MPDALHRELKARAAHAGQTLSDYLLAELERLATNPTRDEMLARLHGRRRVTLNDVSRHRHSRRARVGCDRRRWVGDAAYDAVYIALAEALEAAIVTCDGPLAKAPVTG